MGKKGDSSRLDVLAQYKRMPSGFIEDRRSVYWVDKFPLKPPTTFALTKRQQELTRSKDWHSDFKADRPTPIWSVPTAALHYPERKRLKELAVSKPFHPDWSSMRSVYTLISEGAKTAKPTKRLCELARSKQYDPLLIKSNSSWDWGEWKSDIPAKALANVESGRLDQLAEPKAMPRTYEDNRSVVWPVSAGAKTAQPTTRQQQLARPKTRTALDQDYDPYRVSFAARNATASQRVAELCTPIPRKVRQRK